MLIVMSCKAWDEGFGSTAQVAINIALVIAASISQEHLLLRVLGAGHHQSPLLLLTDIDVKAQRLSMALHSLVRQLTSRRPGPSV